MHIRQTNGLASQNKQVYNYLQLVIICVLPFALFWNLGLMAVHADEGTRGLVALEILFSDNYIVPTINGEYYYNKPPLYNWILVGLIKLFGFSEFILRLPTVLSLIGFAITIYYFVKKNINEYTAFLSAVTFISGGRILFYDSFHGLIDMSFSWLTFLSFIATFHFYEKRNWWLLFLSTYLITAIGFMMKGLPSLVFQSFSLLAYLTYKKDFKKLFHLSHFVAIGLFFSILSSYFWLYSQQNDVALFLRTLLTESTKRTVFLEEGNTSFFSSKLVNYVSYFVRFPFSILGVLMPWGILVVFCFRRNFIQLIQTNKLLTFSVITFLANIIVYWLSPMTKARYLFMLFPFLSIVFAYFYSLDGFKKWKKVIHSVISCLIFLTPLLSFIPLFITKFDFIPNRLLLCIVFSTVFLVVAFCLNKVRNYQLLFMVLFLFIARLFFSLTVFQERNLRAYESEITRTLAKKAGQILTNKEAYRIGDNVVSGSTYLNHDVSMYMTWERQAIIYMRKKWDKKKVLYIVNPYDLEKGNFDILFQFETSWQKHAKTGEHHRFLVKLKE